MRTRLAGLLLAAPMVGVLLSACDPGISFSVVNRTHETICFYTGRSGPPTVQPQGCNEVKPNVEKTWSVICSDGLTLWIVLTVDNREIYDASADCEEWEDSGAWVAVEQKNGEFITSDSLTTPDTEP